MANIYRTTGQQYEPLAEFKKFKPNPNYKPPKGKRSKSLERPKTYDALRKKGMPPGMAAAISNAQAEGTLDYVGGKGRKGMNGVIKNTRKGRKVNKKRG